MPKMQTIKKRPIKPRRLMPGDTIGVVAPASPFNKVELEQGLAAIHNMGYGTHLADGLFASQGYLAGDDQQRVDQLQQMLEDDHIDAIMCARGGYGSLRILPHLDYELMRKRAKPLIGFSDVTALLQAVVLKTGLVTFHGPMATTLAKADPVSQTTWQQALAGDQPLRIFADAAYIIQPGIAQGVVMGGNLATLCHLMGTPFAVAYKDCILFIEETGEALYRIDRMLTQMKMAGCFDGLSGLALGSFKDCGAYEDIVALVAHLFSDGNMPILAGLAVGHSEQNLTVPLGITARLDTQRGELVFLETATAG